MPYLSFAVNILKNPITDWKLKEAMMLSIGSLEWSGDFPDLQKSIEELFKDEIFPKLSSQ
jgi:hypothetical protein